jgi:hypothetical protein
MKFSATVYNEAKRLFIEEELSLHQISARFNGHPSAPAIHKWSKIPDNDGKTWKDYKLAYRDELYNMVSPQAIAVKILDNIQKLLNNENFGTKDADALAKLQKSMQKITDPKYQIPVMYSMLTDQMKFFQKHYPQIVNKDLVDAIRHFKNELGKRLSSGQ